MHVKHLKLSIGPLIQAIQHRHHYSEVLYERMTHRTLILIDGKEQKGLISHIIAFRDLFTSFLPH
jgi:hypothetical protein